MEDTASPALEHALGGCCPRCGKGALFKSWLQFSESCPHCGLDFSRIDSGDGPAYFAICLVGTVVTVGAAMVEIFFKPPYWLHAVLWIPCIVFGSLAVLHYAKAMLAASAYRQGRMEDRDE